MSGTGTPTRRESTLGSTERLSRAGSTTRGIAAPEDGAGSGRGSMTGRGSSASSGGQQPQQRGSIGENSTLAPAAAQQHHRYHRDDTEGDSDADLESEVELEEEELESSTETARSILGALVDHHAPGGAAAAGGDPSSTGTNDDPAVAAAIEKEDARDEAGEGEGDGDTSILADIQSTLDFLSAQTPTAAQAPQDPTLTRLRTEYDKLHKLFLQSRKNEKSLMTKCKSLSSELSSNAAKVAAALKLSQNDRSQITALKKEVRKCWKMVEIGQEKETRAKEAIAQLKGDVEGLRKQMVDVAGSVPGGPAYASFGRDKLIEMQIQQDELIRSLTEQREALQKETLQKTTDLANLQLLTTDLESRVEKLVSERGSLDHELLTLKDLLATKKSELDREARAREKLEVALRQSIDGSTKKDELVTAKMVEVKSARDGIVKLEAVIKEERAKVAVSDKEKENLVARLGRLQQEYDEQVLTTTRLLSENQAQTGEIKGWEEELQKYKEEVRSVVRVRDALQKRIKLVEDGKLEAEVERDQLKGTTHALSHDLETARRSLDQFHKNLDTLTRERDIALKNVTKATAQTTKQVTVVKLADQTKRNLEQEIAGYKDEAAKMRKLIYTLEKDRDRWINEGGKIRLELAAKEEEGKIGEMLLFDCRKKITELERKLKEQQSLYENVRADRNLYSKNLVESQDEITEMRRKLKIMTHQIEQLKEEIANKEGALVKEHFEHSKLEKEKEALSVQIGKLQLQYEEAQQMIQNQQSEENKLRHIISQADADRLRQKKDYETLVQERDILGTQLIRRNDELSLLYEKIKIQTSTLHKGECQYRERLADIRVCKLEIKKLRREKAILQAETQHLGGLRTEIFRLQRDVLRERTRVKVLEEELASPLNIHRWRKLAGSDPSTFELVTKIQTLQKRLLAKTELCVEKELIIHQKEKLYKDVKTLLQRTPGPEVVQELRSVKEAVRHKSTEAKALAAELNTYHSQAIEYQYQLEKLNRELIELKKKHYGRMVKEARNKESNLRTISPNPRPPLPLRPAKRGPGHTDHPRAYVAV